MSRTDNDTSDSSRKFRLVIVGCGHGCLDAIYTETKKKCEEKGWDSVDLLIVCGDFQAVRNPADLNCMAVPQKYRQMADFHRYYSGDRSAPYLTLYVGGNHEASNYHLELFYGGWVAPRIFYMGAANVVEIAGLRIAGLSGIWKGYNYSKSHFERLPFTSDEERSVYHQRQIDVRKLLLIKTQVDIGISHDWPRGIEWAGDSTSLFRKKPFLEGDARHGTLGSVAAAELLRSLRPRYWFSAHLHAKYNAIVHHSEQLSVPDGSTKSSPPHVRPDRNFDNEIHLDLDYEGEAGVGSNSPAAGPSQHGSDEFAKGPSSEPTELVSDSVGANECQTEPETPKASVGEIMQDNRFFHQSTPKLHDSLGTKSKPIQNTTTFFLALDKCLPNRSFLEAIELDAKVPLEDFPEPSLRYDPEWLAITRALANELTFGLRGEGTPADLGPQAYEHMIREAREWIDENIVKTCRLKIPEEFAPTAPAWAYKSDESDLLLREYNNPQTEAFCDLIKVPNIFCATDEDQLARAQSVAAVQQNQSSDHRFGRIRGRPRGPYDRPFNSNRGRGRGSLRRT